MPQTIEEIEKIIPLKLTRGIAISLAKREAYFKKISGVCEELLGSYKKGKGYATKN